MKNHAVRGVGLTGATNVRDVGKGEQSDGASGSGVQYNRHNHGHTATTTGADQNARKCVVR